MTAWETWAQGVLQGVGAPVNQTNVDTLFAWSSAETDPFPLMRWDNPLDTTQPEGAGNVDMNSVGVKSYPTVEQGIQATVTTLLNGYYPLIVDHLRRSIPRAEWGDCCAELGTWGTGCGWLSANYGAAPTGLTGETMTAGQEAVLNQIYLMLRTGSLASGDPSAAIASLPANATGSYLQDVNAITLGRIEAEVKAISASLAGLSAAGLSAAQAQQLSDALAAVQRIESALKAA